MTVAAVVAFVVIVVTLIIINNSHSDSTGRVIGPAQPSSPSNSVSAQPDPTESVIRAAKVGDCLHRRWSQILNGPHDETIAPAQCGNPDATDRVAKVTSTISDCDGIGEAVDVTSEPPVVLCLVKP